jgi:hypothetical protein
VEEQPATRSGRIELLRQRPEPDPLLLQDLNLSDQIPQGPADRRGGRVDDGGELVQQQLPDVAGQVTEAVPVGDDLVVRDDKEHLDAGAL